MRLPGFNPDGVAFGTIESGAVACVPPISVRRSAKQAIMRAFGAAHARATLPAADTLGAADAAGASSTPAVSTAAALITMNTGGLTRISFLQCRGYEERTGWWPVRLSPY
jgi:hypothetical protein